MGRALPFLWFSIACLIAARAYGLDGDFASSNIAPPTAQDLIPLGIGWHEHIISCVLAASAGILLGIFCSDSLRPLRRMVFLAGVSLLVLMLLITPGIGMVVSFIGGFIIARRIFSDAKQKAAGYFRRFSQTVFGTSSWADSEYVKHNGLMDGKGLFIGTFRQRLKGGKVREIPLHYSGDNRHLLTVAPSRAGKGVSTIIPNLLTYEGSMLGIDPKGENALITSARRGNGDPERGIPGMAQEVFIVDPWRIVTKTPACFNPLDWLKPGDEDINENAMILWDGIVMEGSYE